MQFVIIARDGLDEGARERRQKARKDHLLHTENNMEHMVMAAATLDMEEEMNGSVMIVDFPSKKALEAWLEEEPYLKQGVWKEMTVVPCRVGPSFLK